MESSVHANFWQFIIISPMMSSNPPKLKGVLVDIFCNFEETRAIVENRDIFNEAYRLLQESQLEHYQPFACYLKAQCHILPRLILQVINRLCDNAEASRKLGQGIWKLLLQFKIYQALQVLRMNCSAQRAKIDHAISSFNFNHSNIKALLQRCCMMIGEVVSQQDLADIQSMVTEGLLNFQKLFTIRNIVEYTVAIVGNSGVGKSAFITKYVEHKFEDLGPSAGYDYKIKYLDMNGTRVKLKVLDTVGQERYRSLSRDFYRRSQGIILLYDITNRQSFDSLRNIWLTDVEAYLDLRRVDLLVLGNKTDLEELREVPMRDGAQFGQSKNISFMETSVKEDKNVNNAFRMLTQRFLARGRITQPQSIILHMRDTVEQNRRACCRN